MYYNIISNCDHVCNSVSANENLSNLLILHKSPLPLLTFPVKYHLSCMSAMCLYAGHISVLCRLLAGYTPVRQEAGLNSYELFPTHRQRAFAFYVWP